jgi:anaerobic magnesium-protoporphyrin IX monomethyl ester cyclase
MRVCLVGADFEENLGIGMIAAAAEAAGHAVTVVPFNHPRDLAAVATRALAAAPEVVGLGIQFQHRAHEFLALSAALRARGYLGHITAGGQYPTLAWRESLQARYGLDTVVLHDGEETFVDLLAALRDGRVTRDGAGPRPPRT